jgi:UDP-glucose 4-epimerase
LLDAGDSVTVLDDFSTGRRENLARHKGHPRLRIVEGSVLDEDVVDSLMKGTDAVFHLAAAVGVRNILNDPLGSLATNLRGTEHVLASAFRHGSRVLLASTSEIYGVSEKVPFREDGDRVLGPTWIHRWSYSTAKAVDEHLAFAYADRGLRMSIVRYFNCFGPRISETGYGSVVARFAAQALRGDPITVHADGQQTRCFTYVSDTVRGTLLAAVRNEALGTVFNIGSENEMTVIDLAQRIRDRLSSSSRIELIPYALEYPKGFADTRRRVPDVRRATDVLGFSAEVPFDRGLDLTLAWCREQFNTARRG